MKNLFALCILLFGYLFIFPSCKKEVSEPTSSSGSAPAATSGSGYYISFEMNGSLVSMEDGVDNWTKTISIASNPISTDSIQIHPGAGIENYDPLLISPATKAEITFRNNDFLLDTYESDKATVWSSILTLGNHPFMITEDFWGTKGIKIDVRDSNNVYWYSSNQNQNSAASFIVTESIASENSSGVPIRLVKGTFSGVVLSDGTSAITIDNGSFYLPYGL